MRKKNVISIVVLVVAFMVLNANFVSCKNIMTRNRHVRFDLHVHGHHQDHYHGRHHHALYGGYDHQYPVRTRKKKEEGGAHGLDLKCPWDSCDLIEQDCHSGCWCLPIGFGSTACLGSCC